MIAALTGWTLSPGWLVLEVVLVIVAGVCLVILAGCAVVALIRRGELRDATRRHPAGRKP